jgi:hypothetical protein
VAGARHLDLASRGIHDGEQHRRHLTGLEVLHLAVEPAKDLSRAAPFECVGAQRTPHPAHHHGGRHPAPDDVADHDRGPPIRQREDVVPVPPDRIASPWDVARGDGEARHRQRASGQQAALQCDHGRALVLRQPRPRREGKSIRHQLQQLHVAVREPVRADRADVQHTERGSLDDERDAQQALDALVDEDAIGHCALADLVEDHGRALGRHPAREPRPDRDPDALAHLLLQPGGGRRDQLSPGGVEQQDCSRIGVQDLLRAIEELGEQLLELQVRQRRGSDRAQTPQLLGRVLECLCNRWVAAAAHGPPVPAEGSSAPGGRTVPVRPGRFVHAPARLAPAGRGNVSAMDQVADTERVKKRSQDLLPEEDRAGIDDPEAQAAVLLEESEEREVDRRAPMGTPVERRTSSEATPPAV